MRCAKCSHVWFQATAEPEKTPAANPPSVGIDRVDPGREQALDAILTERKPFGSEARLAGEAKPWRSRTLPALGVILVLLLLAVAGRAAVQFRQTVVRLWPVSEQVYGSIGLPVNLTGIAIRNIDLRQQVEDGMPVLFVSGTVVNISDRDQPIPQLRAILFDDSKRELYRWTFDSGISSLSPGASKGFRVPLQNPPPDTHTVNLSFADEDTR